MIKTMKTLRTNPKNKLHNPWLKKLPLGKLFEEYQGSISEPLQAVSPQTTEQPQNISLDQKVDKFFMEYEREASLLGRELTGDVPPSPLAEMRTAKSFSRFLFEAPGDDPMMASGSPSGGPGEAGNDLGGDSGMPDLGGSPEAPGESDEEEPQGELPSPKIDINAFASLLARLIMNVDTLLDPQTTILNRAQAYVAKNYNDTVARELMSKLELQYGMSVRNTAEKNSDSGDASIQVGAAADGGGAAG